MSNQVKRTDIFKVDLSLVNIVQDFNARDFSDPENIARVNEIAKSIEARGQIHPVNAFKEDGKYWLIDGETRFRAIKQIQDNLNENGNTEAADNIRILLRVVPKSETGEENRMFMMLAANDSKPLNPIETAFAYKRLTNMGYTASEISRQLGVSVPNVTNTLYLATAPKYLQDAVKDKKIAVTTVVKLIRESENPDKAKEVVEDLIENQGYSKVKAKDLSLDQNHSSSNQEPTEEPIEESTEEPTQNTDNGFDSEVSKEPNKSSEKKPGSNNPKKEKIQGKVQNIIESLDSDNSFEFYLEKVLQMVGDSEVSSEEVIKYIQSNRTSETTEIDDFFGGENNVIEFENAEFTNFYN
jgi:ParB/RepB/Spo0J family partition protein